MDCAIGRTFKLREPVPVYGRSAMGFSRRLASAVLIISLVAALFGVVASAGAGAVQSATRVSNPTNSVPQLPFSASNRYFDPALQGSSGPVSVLVAMDASSSVREVARYLVGARSLPEVGNVRMLRGLIDSARIQDLQSLPSVLAVLKDRPIGFGAPSKPTVNSRIPGDLRALRLPQPASIERDSLTGGPETSMRQVVNFTGARRAWTQLGVDGTGVTIAVVDTGVDMGTFNLGNGAAARDAAGLPSSFDPDGFTFAFTAIDVPSYSSGGQTWVRTGGTDPLIYIFDLFGVFGPYGPNVLPWSSPRLFNSTYPADMNITGLAPSKSGVYHFGVLFEWNFFIDLFPVLVVDASTAGVYDTAYLDLSFDWWLNGFSPNRDFSFADEPALVPASGNVVAARDMTGDGYPDISAGAASHELDIWGVNPNASERFKILQPVDPHGDYISMVYDWEGHGTSVASSAAGRESNHPLAGPGTGPGAKIMAVPVFAWFDIIEGWLWSAGFDLVGTTTFTPVPNYGGVYGEWTYTGHHKADIISNSWGSSNFLTFQYFFQWPFYDVLTVVEDALMTPGYADPSYPGTVMVHAGGNGASGYGTVTEPGFSNLAITVGASTSLNLTSLPFEGFHNDVISWSARGPTPLGAPKPDVLQVGAFAYASGPVWSGAGNGFNASTLFSGTSQATPVTSGSAAVLIEAYLRAHGLRPSPFVVKSILKSTAIDLGYDAFVQGAGQINVYNAAAHALGIQGILVTSPATWDNVEPMIASSWATASVFYGRQIGVTPPAGPIDDTSWFAGSVRPGSSTSAAFTITANQTVTGSISAEWHTRLSSTTITGTTEVLGAPWLEGYGALKTLSPAAIPAGADLMVAKASMPYSYLDTNGDYRWDNRSRIVIGDWVDANNDGIIQSSEVKVFNYGYNTGTTFEARVGLPVGRFAGTPVLWFSQRPCRGQLVEGPNACLTARTFVPMPFTITVEFYGRVAWPWITAPSTYTASPASPATWTATLAVPPGASPGVYEGQILVTLTGGNATAIPVSVVVPKVIDAATLSGSLTTSGSNQIYDPSTVNGYFDWRWRFEAGDWKLWAVDVADPNTVALRVSVAWTDPRTDVDLWSLNPGLIPNNSSFSPYIGNGAFLWHSDTGTTANVVVLSTQSGLDQPAQGLYRFLLHNVLVGNGSQTQALTGTFGAVKLNPRGPITLVVQPGKTYSIPFELATGYALSYVFGVALPPTFSAFPATMAPEFTFPVFPGGRVPMWANITVPAGTADGTYVNYFVVGGAAAELPQIPIRVNLVVDSTSPAGSIVAPTANAYVHGPIKVQAAASDANGVASVSFTAGAASGTMSKDPTSGLWTATWDTAGTLDGAATIAVIVTDALGIVATITRNVAVDNTAPTASFTSPSGNAWVHGTTVVSFTAADANLDKVTLTYGGTTVVVTGQTSHSLDTKALADGSQTLTLTAVDLAGNTKEAAVTFNVDNTPPTAVLTGPQGGAFLKGGATASFVATDANVATATLTIGTQSFDVKSYTSQVIDTTALADGAYTMTLSVTDQAGNAASSSVSVTIDNTAPAVTISAPASNANLRGTATISWTATDTNLDTVSIAIDGEARDLSGTTSYSWDTHTVGDGTHTIQVKATDKAGNARTVSVSVTTDNVSVATGSAMSAGLLNGLVIGLIAAAIVGFLAGFLIGRRRGPKEPERTSNSEPPNPPGDEL